MQDITKTTAAKEIRKVLKKEFSWVKFSVTSHSNSVNVKWTNGPTFLSVEEKVSKFEYGHFKGMEDIYEYSNVDKSIPQVKFVFCIRNISGEIKAKIKNEIAEDFGIENLEDEQAWMTKTNMWSDQNVWKRLELMNLTDYVL